MHKLFLVDNSCYRYELPLKKVTIQNALHLYQHKNRIGKRSCSQFNWERKKSNDASTSTAIISSVRNVDGPPCHGLDAFPHIAQDYLWFLLTWVGSSNFMKKYLYAKKEEQDYFLMFNMTFLRNRTKIYQKVYFQGRPS